MTRGTPSNLIPFRPGESGNPGGKPVAARNRIRAKFLHALAEDFEEHGPAAIVACREKDPSRYLTIVASLMPKQIETAGPLAELSDEELAKAIECVRAHLAASEDDDD